FDLLLFAFTIWSLLEYRLDEREGRLFLMAFVYGAGMANNWGMTGYFPLLIVATIWTCGFNFFNRRFLVRIILCGLAGMSLFLLLPLLAAGSGEISFWQALKFNLTPQYEVLKQYILFIFHPQQYLQYLALLLVYLMPVLAMSIRWATSFGDRSKVGSTLANFMFHFVYAILFGICLWMAFGPPFSPQEKGFGLTFCYLGALCVGYYSGYFLLVFGKKAVSRTPQRGRPSQFEFLNVPVVGGVWLLAVLSAIGLIYKNAPQIRDANGDTLQHYAALAEEKLPDKGGILLSDDPLRLFVVEAALTRDGRAKDFVPLDTRSLQFPAYHKFLHEKFPRLWPDTVT
ncbi:MAG TPA: hypothetical protein VMD57_01525, partial [Candidatus Baltobacteraceae bacterium]|nr:hypothetical protein [Candidatus Baltobacteraceae bacterium]